MEKTRARLGTEIEDLKLEIEREHNATRNAERLLKQVESQLASANMNLENERRQREVADSTARKTQVLLSSRYLPFNISVDDIRLTPTFIG